MDKPFVMKSWFVAGLVGVPAFIHTLFTGPYVMAPEGYRRVFWIGPVGTTIPFIFLALVFLVHCEMHKRTVSRSATLPRSPYCAATMAWLAMLAFTTFLICQPRGRISSTIGIAVLFTPFCYIPFLLFPYALRAIAGRLCDKSAHAGPNRRA